MSDSRTAAPVRPDLDIMDAMMEVIVTHPQLAADRHTIHVSTENGVVTLTGNVRTPIQRAFLIEQISAVSGVHTVNQTRLFDDESIRLKAGQMLPSGVMANVNKGVVVLTGALPQTISIDDLAEQVAAIPGVDKVLTSL